MGVAADRRATSTTAGAGWLSTVEIKARSPRCSLDDNADAPPPSLPFPSVAGEPSTPSRSAPARQTWPTRGGPVP